MSAYLVPTSGVPQSNLGPFVSDVAGVFRCAKLFVDEL